MLSENRQREAERSLESGGDYVKEDISGLNLNKEDDNMGDRVRVRGGSLSNDAQKMALLEKRFGWDNAVSVPGAGSRHSSQSCSNADGGEGQVMVKEGDKMIDLAGIDDGDKSRTGSGHNGVIEGKDHHAHLRDQRATTMTTKKKSLDKGGVEKTNTPVTMDDGLGGGSVGRKKRRVSRAPVRRGKSGAVANTNAIVSNASGKTVSGGGGKERLTPSLSPFLESREGGAEYSEKKAVTPNGGQNNTISRYFAAKGSQGGSGLSNKEECGPSLSSPLGMSSGRGGECTSVRNLRIEAESLR